MKLNWQKISHLSREEIKELQNKKLRYFIKHELLYSPYYRALFQKNNLSPADFKTTDDLVKIPLSSKADLAPTEADRARPRQFMLQPDEHLIKKYASKKKLAGLLIKKLLGRDAKRSLEKEYKPIHLHFTTGRTALPTPFGYSATDLEILKESGERLLDVIAVPRDQVAINAFPYSPHLAFWLAYYAFVKLGMTSIQTGGGKVMGTLKIIDAIERMKASLVVFIPGYGYHLLREAVSQKRDFSAVKYVVTGGERLSQGARDKIRELLTELGAKEPQVYATYAMTEAKTAWIQCAENTGYHLYPDLEFFEVVDKEGRRVKEGEEGELVYTALGWRGSVVVRYKTGDLCQGIDYGSCPVCGKTVPRIFPDIQRSSEMKEFNLTKVKGELVNLNNFYPLLSGLKEIEEWQVEIRKKDNDPFEVDELILSVALRQSVKFSEYKPKLERIVTAEMGVGVEVEEADLTKLLDKLGMETELKEKRIIDTRPKK